jgi:hypothetical protein
MANALRVGDHILERLGATASRSSASASPASASITRAPATISGGMTPGVTP